MAIRENRNSVSQNQSPILETEEDREKYMRGVRAEDAAMDTLPKVVRQAIANAPNRVKVLEVQSIWDASNDVNKCIQYINTGDIQILLDLM